MIPKELNSLDKLNSKQKESFRSGYSMVVLPKGFELWRFISQKSYNKMGAFWINCKTMTDIMNTFHFNRNYSEKYKKEVIRSYLGILEDWSKVNWRSKIKLSKEVIAYEGIIGRQLKYTEIKDSSEAPFSGKGFKQTEVKGGGKSQYIIPRFENLPNSNDWAKIVHFAHI